jgi:putative membrane protein
MDTYKQPMYIGSQTVGAFFSMLLFFVLIAVAINLVIHFVGKNHFRSTHSSSPIDIIKERYAKGDISKVDFEQLKKDLK